MKWSNVYDNGNYVVDYCKEAQKVRLSLFKNGHFVDEFVDVLIEALFQEFLK